MFKCIYIIALCTNFILRINIMTNFNFTIFEIKIINYIIYIKEYLSNFYILFNL